MKTTRNKPIAARYRKKKTRVTVDFPASEHRKLKAIAALEGVTLQDYIRSKVTIDLDESIISDRVLKPIVKTIMDENKDILKRLSDK